MQFFIDQQNSYTKLKRKKDAEKREKNKINRKERERLKEGGLLAYH